MVLTVESGPVGALVLLLEVEARGAPARLVAESRTAPPFPMGALSAVWGRAGGPGGDRASIPLSDLVVLARYALR